MLNKPEFHMDFSCCSQTLQAINWFILSLSVVKATIKRVIRCLFKTEGNICQIYTVRMFCQTSPLPRTKGFQFVYKLCIQCCVKMCLVPLERLQKFHKMSYSIFHTPHLEVNRCIRGGWGSLAVMEYLFPFTCGFHDSQFVCIVQKFHYHNPRWQETISQL